METHAMINKKGILLINSLEGGGAERVFTKLIHLMTLDTNINYTFEVVLLDKSDEKYTLPSNVKVHRIASSKALGFFKLGFLLRKTKPDFVLSFLTRSNIYNISYSRLLNYRSFISERANTSNKFNGRFKTLKNYLLQFFYSKAHKIIACSQGVSTCLVNDFQIKQSNITVIQNPYNINKLEQLACAEITPSPTYIVAVGRLIKQKGFHDLIRSFARVDTDIRLKILGQGPWLNTLIEIARECGVEDRVDFLGFVENPYPIIKHSLFYILSSYNEGFPNTLVEAMALSKTVVATNCLDGPSEILNYSGEIKAHQVISADYGFLVNMGDIDAMSNIIRTLINNDNLLNEYSRRSYIRASIYSEETFYSKCSEFINNNISK